MSDTYHKRTPLKVYLEEVMFYDDDLLEERILNTRIVFATRSDEVIKEIELED